MRLEILLLIVFAVYHANASSGKVKTFNGLLNKDVPWNSKKIERFQRLMLTYKIKFGYGGETVATYHDRRYLIKNGVRYGCSGQKVDFYGKCPKKSKLIKASIKTQKDFCYTITRARMGNYICLSDSRIRFIYIDGRVSCVPLHNTRTQIWLLDGYKKLCGNHPVKYVYHTQTLFKSDIANLECTKKKPYQCTITEFLEQPKKKETFDLPDAVVLGGYIVRPPH